EMDSRSTARGYCGGIFRLWTNHRGARRKYQEQISAQAEPPEVLQKTVDRYNSFVDGGKDEDFGKPAPKHKIQTPPFYAAWSTPVLHDTRAGLRINAKCQVIDFYGNVIPGLY